MTRVLLPSLSGVGNEDLTDSSCTHSYNWYWKLLAWDLEGCPLFKYDTGIGDIDIMQLWRQNYLQNKKYGTYNHYMLYYIINKFYSSIGFIKIL